MQQEIRMSALPKSRLPKEFKILPRKPSIRHEPSHAEAKIDANEVSVDEVQARHQRFVDAVHAAFGMWKGREDIPGDGLEYERWLRGKCP
jgi:hypothetical protein